MCRSCACNETLLVGSHSRRSSILTFGTLSTTAAAACTLRLTHRPRRLSPPSRKQGGGGGGLVAPVPAVPPNVSKFKLMAVIVTPFAVDAADKDLTNPRGFQG